VFEVEVTEVREKIAPALDDAFAKAYGADNLDRLREGVWADLERELNYQKGRVTRSQISKALLDGVQCELPEVVLVSETRRLVFEIVEENRKRGVPAELISQNEADIYKTAKSTAVDRIKLAFIFQRIAQKESIELKREEIFERVQQLAAQAETTVEKYMKELDKGAGIAWVYEMVMNEKVMAFLVKNAKIEEVPAVTPPQETTPQA
jgi:trigger factor